MTKTQELTDVVRATDTFELIHPGLIVPDPRNVRDDVGDVTDLANSIFQTGLQAPLRVRLVKHGFLPDDPAAAVYVVIAGHRRLAAIRSLIEKELWFGDVPCMVAPDDLTVGEITASMLVENLQRADLNPIEEARAFDQLIKLGYTRPDLALKISRSETYVADRLALLKLPESVQESVRVGHYPLTAALLLKNVSHEIAEQVTNGGRRVALDHEISRAVEEAKFERLQKLARAKFAELVEGGLAELDNANEWWSFAKKSKEHVYADAYKEIEALNIAALPKKAVGRLEIRQYSRSVVIEIRVPLTPKQLTDLEKKEIAEAERAEAEERASWTPEYTAWRELVDQLKAADVEYTAAWEAALHEARKAWAQQLPAKTVARFAMLYVVISGGTYDLAWQRKRAAVTLGLLDSQFVSDAIANETIATYCQQGAAQLSTFTAAVLLQLGAPDAEEDFGSFCRKHDISTEKPAPSEIPPAPAMYADGTSDEEFNDDEPDDE